MVDAAADMEEDDNGAHKNKKCRHNVDEKQ